MTNVGVFDSGLGGLTVLNELAKKRPANYFYLGDSARAPYGIRSTDEIISFAEQIVSFLEKYEIDEYVIACNTISVLATDFLKEKFNKNFIPIPEAGIAAAMESHGSYMVLATNATVNSHYYKNKLSALGKSPVYEVAGTELVRLIEQGQISGEEMDYYLGEYLSIANQNEIDNIILACTHYPIIEKAIRNNLNYQANIINPASKIAEIIDFKDDSDLNINIFMTDLNKASEKLIDEIIKLPYKLELKEI